MENNNNGLVKKIILIIISTLLILFGIQRIVTGISNTVYDSNYFGEFRLSFYSCRKFVVGIICCVVGVILFKLGAKAGKNISTNSQVENINCQNYNNGNNYQNQNYNNGYNNGNNNQNQNYNNGYNNGNNYQNQNYNNGYNNGNNYQSQNNQNNGEENLASTIVTNIAKSIGEFSGTVKAERERAYENGRTIYCQHCGAKNEITDKYCSGCGAPIK